ncbi:MAG: transglutaminase domain-containing protein [Acidimicrobiia bacterium]
MTSYLLRQAFRYDYSAPVTDLRHRLVVVPPEVHGDQTLVRHAVDVTGAPAERWAARDRFGNHVIHVRAEVVEETIAFEAKVEVVRCASAAPAVVGRAAMSYPAYLRPSRLTVPSAAVLGAAAELTAVPGPALELAERITGWVHARMRYDFDATTVHTTAAEALDLGAGVCQDYAHVMLAVSRACGLPARYVSGHLLGEGGSHAWVEVLVEDQGHADRALAVAFDPTHDRRAEDGYLTVAVGRDYVDVAPTAGTFESPVATGRLSCRKRLDVADAADATAPRA